MTVSVVEVTVGTDAGAVSNQTVALATTPVAGDVVVLAYASTRNTARNVSSVSGLTGATWARAGGGAGTVEFWLGTGATAAGTITAAQTGTGRGILTVYLVRGLTATTGVVSRTNAASVQSLTGPAQDAVTGQIAITCLATNQGTTVTFPSGTTAPTTGWNANTVASDGSGGGKVGGAYRIPSAAAASHRNDATSSGTMTLVTSGILTLGDEVVAAATISLAADLRRKTGALSLFGNADLHLTADLQRKTGAFTLDAGPMVTLAGELRRKTGAFTLEAVEATIDLDLVGTLRRKTGAFTLDAGPFLTLAGSLRAKTAVLSLFGNADLHLTADLQRKTGAFAVTAALDSAYIAEVLADSPHRYYRLGESSGTTMLDSSGNAEHGTYAGSYALGVTGLLADDSNTAAAFHSATGTVPHADTTTEFSIDALLAPRAASNPWQVRFERAGIFRVVIGHNGSSPYGNIVIDGPDPGLTDEATFTFTPPEAPYGTHQHVAVTFAGTGAASNLKLYVDGASITLTNVGGDPDILNFNGADGSTPLLVTGVAPNDPGHHVVLDEVAYYTTALSGARVLAHAAAVPAGLTLAASLRRKTAAFTLVSVKHLTLSASLRRKTGAFTLQATAMLALAGTLQPKTGAFTIVIPPQTDTSNMAGGITFGGYAVHTWEPAVVDPATALIGAGVAHDYETAIAFSTPSIVGTRPVYSITQARTKRHRDRIVCGGKDITYLWGVHTPTPNFRLVEPLVYGAGTLELPQFNPAFEAISDYPWLALGKPVIVQRVDWDTNEVVATDYRGFIDSHDLRGNTLILSLGGQISGRASLADRQPALFRQIKDVGRWVSGAVVQTAPVRFTPRGGPVTGIEIASRGGASMYDYISELLALSAHQNGAQYTVERHDDGAYHMSIKDRTTIDATIYFDGNRMVADLHDSLAERPNRVFVTGITPEGQRVRFGGYPGLRQGAAAPYPMNDNSAFGIGTTDAETDTGDGVTVMQAHLLTMGYLTFLDTGGAYDAQVADAIEMLQDEADLPQTGIMNLATWRALYDLSVTGYSIAGSRILPAAQRSAVKKFLLSASGAIIAKNPNWNPHAVIVDHSINLGNGFTRQQMRRWARAILRDALDANWVGTATCHLALIRGEHHHGDALTNADVMSGREMKPGMNVLGHILGQEILFHVSGVDVPEGGRDVVLTIDTKARDTMAAWECITRNRESRTNPARAWINSRRTSGMEKDAYGEFDEVSGLIDAQHLTPGWNHFDILAGQAGTIRKLRVETNPPTEFVASLSAREISDARMTHLVPAPLTEAGTARWEKAWVVNALDGRIHLESWGGYHQPCGYGTRQKYTDNDELTDAPLTGVLVDPASIGYYTLGGTFVLWLAIWVPTGCTIPAGRIMWNQLEGGAA